MRAANAEWRDVAARLIRHAHVIVLILPPDREFGEGFFWEIDQIRRNDAVTRTLIVLPPYDQDAEAHRAALHRACMLLGLLDGELDNFKAHEYELLLPSTTLVIRCTRQGANWWQAIGQTSGRRRKTVVADGTYLDGLERAMLEIDHEHP